MLREGREVFFTLDSRRYILEASIVLTERLSCPFPTGLCFRFGVGSEALQHESINAMEVVYCGVSLGTDEAGDGRHPHKTEQLTETFRMYCPPIHYSSHTLWAKTRLDLVRALRKCCSSESLTAGLGRCELSARFHATSSLEKLMEPQSSVTQPARQACERCWKRKQKVIPSASSIVFVYTDTVKVRQTTSNMWSLSRRQGSVQGKAFHSTIRPNVR